MAKHILCFLAMLIAARSSFSQDCTEATLMQKPGDWKEGFKGLIVPVHNAREAGLVNNLQVYGVSHINELIKFFANEENGLE